MIHPLTGTMRTNFHVIFFYWKSFRYLLRLNILRNINTAFLTPKRYIDPPPTPALLYESPRTGGYAFPAQNSHNSRKVLVLSQQILCHVYFEKASLVLCHSFSPFFLSAIVFSVRKAQEAHLIKHCIRLA